MKYTILLNTIILILFGCSGGSEQGTALQKAKPEALVSGEQAPEAAAKNTKKTKYILFFGDSITAGYGLDEKDAFTTLIQNRINEKGLDYKVVNAGLSGETTAGGARRINWVLKQQVDFFILELGGNDMLRGIDTQTTEENLRSILKELREKKPEIPVIVAGMQAPDNMGPEYGEQFSAIFPKLAEEFNAGLIPFVLEGVAGDPKLNQPDGIHPNAEGEKIVMENIWKVLKDYL